MIEEFDSGCQGLEASTLLSHTRFHMDLQLWVSMVLLTRGLEKRKKYWVEQKTRLSHSVLLNLFLSVSKFLFSHHFITISNFFLWPNESLAQVCTWGSKGTTV